MLPSIDSYTILSLPGHADEDLTISKPGNGRTKEEAVTPASQSGGPKSMS